MEAITVSQINNYIKNVFASDIYLKAVTIKGEISNFTNHKKTGHFYFTLKDEQSSIKAVMFKGYADKVPFDVENGMNVIIRGSIQVFTRDGTYQIYCQTLEPDGIGALYLAFEQLKQKLAEKGWFDECYKKEIPKYPKKIGVVTAKTGAALQDILNILTRRYPICQVILINALVQGEKAPQSIVDGITLANTQNDIDVLIVGRGGGSIEDLWCFNNEMVAKAIFESKIPVISAVGHEIDFTISDFVADLRAPTPSAAAELATPNISDIYADLQNCNNMLQYYSKNLISQKLENLKAAYKHLQAFSPTAKIDSYKLSVDNFKARLDTNIKAIADNNCSKFLNLVSTLEALSPLKVINRGYSITYKEDNSIVKHISDINVNDIIKTKISGGEVISTVNKITKKRKSKKD